MRGLGDVLALVRLVRVVLAALAGVLALQAEAGQWVCGNAEIPYPKYESCGTCQSGGEGCTFVVPDQAPGSECPDSLPPCPTASDPCDPSPCAGAAECSNVGGRAFCRCRRTAGNHDHHVYGCHAISTEHCTGSSCRISHGVCGQTVSCSGNTHLHGGSCGGTCHANHTCGGSTPCGPYNHDECEASVSCGAGEVGGGCRGTCTSCAGGCTNVAGTACGTIYTCGPGQVGGGCETPCLSCPGGCVVGGVCGTIVSCGPGQIGGGCGGTCTNCPGGCVVNGACGTVVTCGPGQAGGGCGGTCRDCPSGCVSGNSCSTPVSCSDGQHLHGDVCTGSCHAHHSCGANATGTTGHDCRCNIGYELEDGVCVEGSCPLGQHDDDGGADSCHPNHPRRCTGETQDCGFGQYCIGNVCVCHFGLHRHDGGNCHPVGTVHGCGGTRHAHDGLNCHETSVAHSCADGTHKHEGEHYGCHPDHVCGADEVGGGSVDCSTCVDGEVPNADASACIDCANGEDPENRGTCLASCPTGQHGHLAFACHLTATVHLCADGTHPHPTEHGVCRTDFVCTAPDLVGGGSVPCSRCAAGYVPNAARDGCTRCPYGETVEGTCDEEGTARDCGSCYASHPGCSGDNAVQCSGVSVCNDPSAGANCATGNHAHDCMPCHIEIGVHNCPGQLCPSSFGGCSCTCPAGAHDTAVTYIPGGHGSCHWNHDICSPTQGNHRHGHDDECHSTGCADGTHPHGTHGTNPPGGHHNCHADHECGNDEIGGGATDCTECGDGTVPNEAGDACIRCGVDAVEPSSGSCIGCIPGEVPNAAGTACVACDGDSAESTPGECVECVDDEVPNEAGTACIGSCSAGSHRHPTGCHLVTVVHVCIAGYHLPGGEHWRCRENYVCGADEVGGGTVSCMTCGAGLVPDSASVSCVSCGSDSAETVAGSCTGCGAGEVANAGGTACVSCGTDRVESSPGTCTGCGAGQVPSSSGVECEACGERHAETSAGTCVDCGEGMGPDEAGTACVTASYTCGADEAGGGTVPCVACGAGEVPNGDASACVACGSNAAEVNAGTCTACGAGEVSDTAGTACVSCGKDAVETSNNGACVGCGEGDVANSAGTLCVACAEGEAETTAGTCVACGEGQDGGSSDTAGVEVCVDVVDDDDEGDCEFDVAVMCGPSLVCPSGKQCSLGRVCGVPVLICLPDGTGTAPPAACPDGQHRHPVCIEGRWVMLPCHSTGDLLHVHYSDVVIAAIPCEDLVDNDRCGVDRVLQGPSSMRACVRCGRGLIDDDGTMQCVACPEGHAEVVAGSCFPCPPGTQVVPRGTQLEFCAPCGPDGIAPTGADVCQACPSGQVANETRTACVDCPTDHVESAPGTCTECANGQVPAASKVSCVSCGVDAVEFPAGTCLTCRPGLVPKVVVDSEAADALNVCVSCEEGCIEDPDNAGSCIACIGGLVPNVAGTLCIEIDEWLSGNPPGILDVLNSILTALQGTLTVAATIAGTLDVNDAGTHSRLDTLAGYLDGVEGYIDGIEGLLSAIGDNTLSGAARAAAISTILDTVLQGSADVGVLGRINSAIGGLGELLQGVDDQGQMETAYDVLAEIRDGNALGFAAIVDGLGDHTQQLVDRQIAECVGACQCYDAAKAYCDVTEAVCAAEAAGCYRYLSEFTFPDQSSWTFVCQNTESSTFTPVARPTTCTGAGGDNTARDNYLEELVRQIGEAGGLDDDEELPVLLPEPAEGEDATYIVAADVPTIDVEDDFMDNLVGITEIVSVAEEQQAISRACPTLNLALGQGDYDFGTVTVSAHCTVVDADARNIIRGSLILIATISGFFIVMGRTS